MSHAGKPTFKLQGKWNNNKPGILLCEEKKIIEPAVKVKTVTVGDGAKYYLSTLE